LHKTFEELGYVAGDVVECVKSQNGRCYKVGDILTLIEKHDTICALYKDNGFLTGEDGDWELVTVESDPVEKPAHYNQSSIECIVYLEDNMPHEAFIGYLEGNTKKYLHRWRYKDKPVEDLKKALWYLDRMIKTVEKNSAKDF